MIETCEMLTTTTTTTTQNAINRSQSSVQIVLNERGKSAWEWQNETTSTSKQRPNFEVGHLILCGIYKDSVCHGKCEHSTFVDSSGQTRVFIISLAS